MNRSNQLPNLDKLFKDDDEQDFTPFGGSNLAAIFGTSSHSLDPSVSTKAQKKINVAKSSPQKSSPSKTEVILAKVVHVYKLQNSQYNLIGKLGIALTSNISTKTYLLILYRSNREHVNVVTLTADFKYSVQENNYANFYDGNNENWSILFDDSESSIEFSREIGIAKYSLRLGKTDEIIFYQDLTVGSGENDAKEGDTVHLKYVIITSINQPCKMSSIPIQSMVTQISSDNNWERSLLGVTKGLKRILILSPSKQISLGPGFPRDKDIGLDIEVTDVVTPEIKRTSSPKPPAVSGKAALISRMAKMGQSMLPLQKPVSTTTDSEDTEDEVDTKSPRRLKAHPVEVVQKSASVTSEPASTISVESQDTPVHIPPNVAFSSNFIPSNPSPHGALISTGSFTPSWTTTAIPQQFISGIDGQLYQYPAAVPSAAVTSSIDPNINVFLSEARTHNAEIRMGMSKIADSVQKLLDKFHILEVQNAVASPNNEKALDTSIKMLLAMNMNKNTFDNKANDSISTEINSANAVVLSLEKEQLKEIEEKLRCTNNLLDENVAQLRIVEKEKKDLETEKMELKEKIEKLESSLSESRNLIQDLVMELKIANGNEMQYQKDNAKLEAKIIKLDAEKKVLTREINSQKRNIASDGDKAAEMKQIMNKVYQTLIAKFTDETYRSDFIKSTIATTIRAITLQCIKEKNDIENMIGMVIKDTGVDQTKIPDDSTAIETEDTICLPTIDKPLDEMNVRSSTQGPPPIPPMDLEIDNNGLPYFRKEYK